MMSSNFAKFVLALTVLLLIQEVRTQKIRFSDEDPFDQFYAPSARVCASSLCVSLKECRPFRSLPDRQNVGITCGPGREESRQICCPSLSGGHDAVPISEATVRRSNVNFKQKRCGRPAGKNMRTKYIMGGEYAMEGAWPWMVAIRFQERGSFFGPICSGFLIDKRHVISAAHCYHNKNVTRYIARIGRVNQEEADTYKIDRIAVPQSYVQDMFYNDIAVLTLTRNVSFAGFNPVCLPDETLLRQNLQKHGTAVAGWGVDRPGGSMSVVLREIRRMPIVPNNECKAILKKRMPYFHWQFPNGIDKGLMCAGFTKGEKDACWGDSGGPLMQQHRNKWFVIGVVSFGFSCGLPGTPAGYTRIDQHLNWIWENTRN